MHHEISCFESFRFVWSYSISTPGSTAGWYPQIKLPLSHKPIPLTNPLSVYPCTYSSIHSCIYVCISVPIHPCTCASLHPCLERWTISIHNIYYYVLIILYYIIPCAYILCIYSICIHVCMDHSIYLPAHSSIHSFSFLPSYFPPFIFSFFISFLPSARR